MACPAQCPGEGICGQKQVAEEDVINLPWPRALAEHFLEGKAGRGEIFLNMTLFMNLGRWNLATVVLWIATRYVRIQLTA